MSHNKSNNKGRFFCDFHFWIFRFWVLKLNPVGRDFKKIESKKQMRKNLQRTCLQVEKLRDQISMKFMKETCLFSSFSLCIFFDNA